PLLVCPAASLAPRPVLSCLPAPPPTAIYALSLHDALPIYSAETGFVYARFDGDDMTFFHFVRILCIKRWLFMQSDAETMPDAVVEIFAVSVIFDFSPCFYIEFVHLFGEPRLDGASLDHYHTIIV